MASCTNTFLSLLNVSVTHTGDKVTAGTVNCEMLLPTRAFVILIWMSTHTGDRVTAGAVNCDGIVHQHFFVTLKCIGHAHRGQGDSWHCELRWHRARARGAEWSANSDCRHCAHGRDGTGVCAFMYVCVCMCAYVL